MVTEIEQDKPTLGVEKHQLRVEIMHAWVHLYAYTCILMGKHCSGISSKISQQTELERINYRQDGQYADQFTES